MKPLVLISNFLGGITFPHYTKFKEDNGVLIASVVYDSLQKPIKGDCVTHRDLQKNTRIFEIKETTGHRKAKGDWSFRGDLETMFCEITAKQVGFWNPIKDHPDGGTVSAEYITDKKAA